MKKPADKPVFKKRRWFAACAEYAGLLVALAALLTFFAIRGRNFFTVDGLSTIANESADLAVIAVGMTFVLVIGGIDLSVGSLVAFSSAVIGVLMVDSGIAAWEAVAICILAGMLLGAINGAISVGAGIPSFIVTLGMLEIARGMAFYATDSQTKYIGSSIAAIAEPITIGNVSLKVAPALLIAIAVVLISQFVLTRTVFGRHCIAIGTNREAVRMSGINTVPICIAVFAISGLLCGLGAWMLTARLATSDPNAAVGMELKAIAAAVIGGTSLMGGRGNVINTFLGVLIIAVLVAGLSSIGASEPVKYIVTGSVIIVAVLIDSLRNRWKALLILIRSLFL